MIALERRQRLKYFTGIPASPGYAIGKVTIVHDQVRVACRKISQSAVAGELERLDSAIKMTAADLELRIEDATQKLGEQFGDIFKAHSLILCDSSLRKRIEKTIKDDLYCAEYALWQNFTEEAKKLRNLPDAIYAERAGDVIDVRDQALRKLMAKSEIVVESESPTILVANSLSPSDASKIDPRKTIALVTETGGAGSHTAILATAFGIPTLLGVGPFISHLDQNQLVIVDGSSGLLIVDPDEETFARYRRKKAEFERQNERRKALSDKPVIKKENGEEIEINGNIELPHELDECVAVGVYGIGLYRTEFLWLSSADGKAPDEETQFQTYKSVLETMKPLPTTIRTFDLGADKTVKERDFAGFKEINPNMGLRSIRLSLRYTDMFRTQLRAILRASVYGKVKIMFPLVTTISEWRQARSIFLDVCEDLEEEGVDFDRNIPLGIMVETPASVIMLERFVEEVSFFSIGSNDLLQYTHAVDRDNTNVAGLYQWESPALLRFIRHAVNISNRYGKPLSLCGQMGGDAETIPLLLGLGLRSLSVPSYLALATKEVCERFPLDVCEDIAREAWTCATAEDVRLCLRQHYREVMGFDLD